MIDIMVPGNYPGIYHELTIWVGTERQFMYTFLSHEGYRLRGKCQNN